MKETPILFSTPMVQAILNGTKTQTRRVVKGAARAFLEVEFTNEFTASSDNNLCPYGKVGNLLWVRETYTHNGLGYHRYKADFKEGTGKFTGSSVPDKFRGKWKPSIHMPKAAARLWLQITGIRVERLQTITEADAKAEGIEIKNGLYKNYYKPLNIDDVDFKEKHPVVSFHSLWFSINGPDSWRANPWVWVIEFKVISKTGKP